MGLRLGDIAERLGADLLGDPDYEIREVCDWHLAGEAGEGLLAFETRSRPGAEFMASPVRALIVAEEPGAEVREGKHYLVHRDPRLAFAVVAGLLHPDPRAVEHFVHPSAFVEDGAQLEAPVHVGPLCVIGAGARVGSGTVLVAQCHVGAGTVLGRDCVVQPFAAILGGAVLGDRVYVEAGCVVASEGFGNARQDGRFVRIPHLGKARVEDDVRLGANACVDRGALGDTVVEEGARIDNLVQIGHNCVVGAHAGLAGLVGLAGSTRIGKRCLIGGQAGFAGHLGVAADSVIGAMTGVPSSLEEPGFYLGVPARPARDTKRMWAAQHRLPDLLRRIDQLEKRIAELEGDA
ncbi:MAG: UDP-3-O-(3-hydroxymyristoyl)glucosamine N-acyltransferase [Planctomycetota bacterium]